MDEEEVPEKEVKQEGREENIRKRTGRRLKIKATKKSKRQKTDSDLKEEEQLRASLKIVPDEEEKIDYEVLGTSKKYPHKGKHLKEDKLRLTAESEGKVVFDLLRFIQKQIDELGDQDGSENDL
ncbi:hypothetical protein Tco_1329821 [Tanacetum coccineum]